jgi:hypothetical protein
VRFKMLRERIPVLSAMTLDDLGAKMRCDKCGKTAAAYDKMMFILEPIETAQAAIGVTVLDLAHLEILVVHSPKL